MTEPIDNRTPVPETAEGRPENENEALIIDELPPELRRVQMESRLQSRRDTVNEQARHLTEQARELAASNPDETRKNEIIAMIEDSLDQLEELDAEEQAVLAELDAVLASDEEFTDEPPEIAEMIESPIEITPEQERTFLFEEARDIGPDNPGSLERAAQILASDSSAAGQLDELGFSPDQFLAIANRSALLNEGQVNHEKISQALGLTADQAKQLQQTAERLAAASLDWRLLADQVNPGEQLDGGTRQHLIDTVMTDLPLAARKLDQIGLDTEQRQQLALSLLDQKPFAFMSLGRRVDFSLSAEQQQKAVGKLLELARDSNRPDIYGSACFAARLDNQQIEKLLSEMPAVERLNAMEAMALTSPERAYDSSQLETWTEQRAETNPEIAAQVESIQQAEQALAQALEQAGGRAAEIARQNQALEQRLATGRMTGLEELVDINDPNQAEAARSKPLRLFVEGRALPAVCKPAERDLGDPTVPESMEPGSSMKREWLTYQVAKAAGINRVPVTALRNTPFGVAAVQEWRVSQGTKGERWLDRADNDDRYREELKTMGALDVIMRQMDRHTGNWAESPDGEIVIFDNGLSAMRPPTNQADAPANMMRCNALWAVEGESLPDELVASFQQLKEQRDGPLGQALKQCFDTALGDTSDEMYQHMWEQVDQLLENGYPPSEFDSSPNPDFRAMEEEERKTAL